jgi:hypothetical protein
MTEDRGQSLEVGSGNAEVGNKKGNESGKEDQD